jgi:TatD family-associated radical SAM protein
MNTKYTIAYEYHNSLYLNITNRCPNLCVFCIKNKWNMDYRGYNLKLLKEPSVEDIKVDVEKNFLNKNYDEIVFCGYGEPTMRWDTAKEFIMAVRSGSVKSVPPKIRIRINTNGLGNLINKRDITLEMKGLVDALHISLNTRSREQWVKLMQPFNDYRDNGFDSVIDFIKRAKESVKEVIVTAVELEEVDIKAVENLANLLGVGFRRRPLLDYEEA